MSSRQLLKFCTLQIGLFLCLSTTPWTVGGAAVVLHIFLTSELRGEWSRSGPYGSSPPVSIRIRLGNPSGIGNGKKKSCFDHNSILRLLNDALLPMGLVVIFHRMRCENGYERCTDCGRKLTCYI
jgi:hypothetical protein